jgi:hypothetical protein
MGWNVEKVEEKVEIRQNLQKAAEKNAEFPIFPFGGTAPAGSGEPGTGHEKSWRRRPKNREFGRVRKKWKFCLLKV